MHKIRSIGWDFYFFFDVFHKFLEIHEDLSSEIIVLAFLSPIKKMDGSDHEFGAHKSIKKSH